MSAEDKNNLSESLRRMADEVSRQAGERGLDLLRLLSTGHEITGVCHTKIIGIRVPHDEKLGGLCIVALAEMTDDEMRRFTDYVRAFMQDVSSGNGFKSEEIVAIDNLPEAST